MTFTSEDKLKPVERELGFRHRVYARRVAEGKMTQERASREIAILVAIAEDYREKAEGERPI